MDKNSPAPKAKMGRPPKELNWDRIEVAAKCFATREEIAADQNCHADTISDAVEKKYGITFSEYSKQKQGACRLSLRNAMIRLALSGNVTMMIWVSKQRSIGLNYADEQKIMIQQPADNDELFELINKMDNDK